MLPSRWWLPGFRVLVAMALVCGRSGTVLAIHGHPDQDDIIGEVGAVGRRRSWSIVWNPATNRGRIHPNGTFDYRA